MGSNFLLGFHSFPLPVCVGPGIFFVLPCIDDYCKVDMRTVSFDVPPQEILSRDSVTVTVDAVVYYRISDPLKAVIQVSNYSNSTRLLAATTLRNVLGTRNLSELLTGRENISQTMQISLDAATDPWGVKVERVEMYVLHSINYLTIHKIFIIFIVFSGSLFILSQKGCFLAIQFTESHGSRSGSCS